MGIPIQRVADKLNLKYHTTANIETGNKNPTLEQLKIYGLIFGCEWSELLNEASSLAEIENEFIEIKKYCDEMKKECKKKQVNEDLKINNNIDESINAIAERLIKDKGLIDESKVVNLREGIKMLIKNQAKYLKS